MALIFFLVLLCFYTFFQSISIYGGDAGDLVSAAYVAGTAHPPGYPLYTFIGHLLTLVPFSTVAWRVSLLSSVPTALALTILFIFVSTLTKSKLSSLIACISLGLTYLYWLYASVPEVFALNTLFAISLIYLLYLWAKCKNIKLLYLFFFIFGLSLTHHHIILFLTPAFIYQIYSNKKAIGRLTLRSKLIFLGLFLAGLTPYIYIYLVAIRIPPITWNDPVNLGNFIRLVTRAQYGTFHSGIHYTTTLASRFLQLPVIFELMLEDFAPFGILLAGAGAVFQYIKRRSIFKYLFIGYLFSGPFYFFYASYNLFGEFNLATLERFLHPSYIFIAIWVTEGIACLQYVFTKVIGKFAPVSRAKIYSYLLYLIFIIMPISLFYINYPRISILRQDLTAENLAYDILNSAPKNSILLLSQDIPIFNSQYIYYTQKIRADIKLIPYGKLFAGEYNKQIKKYYPDLILPQVTGQKFVDEFIKKNYSKFPVYSNTLIGVNIRDSAWAPYGLLYKFELKKDPSKDHKLFKINEKLWQSYHDPLTGSLGKFKNLMLFNVVEYYFAAHLRAATFAVIVKNDDSAIKHLRQAQRLIPSKPDTYFTLAVIYNNQKQCKEAIRYAEKAKDIDDDFPGVYPLISKIYRECFEDEKKAASYEKLFKNKIKKEEIPVKNL